MLLCGVWEMHCNNLRLVLGLGLVRVSSRVRVSVLVRVSIRTNWVVNFALPASNLHSSQTVKCQLKQTEQCYKTVVLQRQ